ncbi:class I SAM-dependent methyltransferase [Gammaproteobacteria bacterium]|nr:class I SAM-dependent methyltransferase [Gammaproteobacteria bacterium]MDC0090593.1 class I SAM-dependent methyltransferase [Gammaproteobacteria bacterium]
MYCIVCNNQSAKSFQTSDTKTYWKCGNCLAKFLDPSLYIEAGIEKERYLEHDNRIDDEAYRSFLSRLANPLQKKLSVDDTGLDFGCGHGPALADMLQAEGFQIDLYDPFFFPDKKVFTKKYNFITCTETAEHFHDPHQEFNALDNLLSPGGWLGVMTCFLTTDEAFESWYYRRDPTHVTFYCEKTFEVIASQRNWQYEFPSKDIVLLQKPND